MKMIYISPTEKLSITFTVDVPKFETLYDQSNQNIHVTVAQAYDYYTPIIKQFAKEMELPEVFVTDLHEQELDNFLMQLETAPERLLERYIYLLIPTHLSSSYLDCMTDKQYMGYGINKSAILLNRYDNQDYLAAAAFDEFKERFIAIQRV